LISFQHALNVAESYLIKTQKMTIAFKLMLADKFSLEMLQKKKLKLILIMNRSILQGFIKDDKIIVEARFTKIEVSGVAKPLEFDFSSPAVGSDNVVLIIEGKKVHVSKNYLAVHSPVF
ncbi:hypothetical protein PFISCL1PPCAC_20984, partial [Pristionchus fissidentatus]